MNFEKHSDLKGTHAFLSPSNHAWLRYDKDKLVQVFLNKQKAEQGTRLHAFAEEAIKLKIQLPKTKKTLNLYVNDAIKLDMTPEVCLYYSSVCYGWADTISFDEDARVLRIHDLKTGDTPASMEQLEIYAALFCLEYTYKPKQLSDIELRIYQNDQVLVHHPEKELISEIMEIIIKDCNTLERVKKEVGK